MTFTLCEFNLLLELIEDRIETVEESVYRFCLQATKDELDSLCIVRDKIAALRQTEADHVRLRYNKG